MLQAMSVQLPFDPVTPYIARRFVPAAIDLGNWEQIAPLFDQLETRLAACTDLASFEKWLLDSGELGAALDEEGSRRYIAMTCHTDDPEAEKSYLHFVEKIEPELKPRQFELSKRYLQHPLRASLARPRYEVFDRTMALQVELFRMENVPLETEEAKLGQQYQKITGGLTVNFRGTEQTLVQMGRHLEEPDRALRQEAWELVAARRLAEADNLESILDAQLKIRDSLAKNAGHSNYRDYAFRLRGRFDYTPLDCQKFHEAIASEVMPLLREIQAERKSRMGLDTLKPWDLSVDPLARPPLKPFTTVEQLLGTTQSIFEGMDPVLNDYFKLMREKGLLDLANRKGKAPGGYQSTLSESRLPFIFMNAVGLQRDVETLLHEAGHAFHALAAREEPLHAYRSAPIEFCEVASMSMELLGQDRIEAFYSAGDSVRSRRTHLEGIVGIFPWIATVDAFQHWLYTHPGHSSSERRSAWLELMDRFGGEVDWTGHDATRATLWHRQLHIFLYPFYYVEYGIAQLGALQVWANAKRDRAGALQKYRSALALGGSLPLPALFEAAGCKFDFSAEAIRPLMADIRAELSRLK